MTKKLEAQKIMDELIATKGVDTLIENYIKDSMRIVNDVQGQTHHVCEEKGDRFCAMMGVASLMGFMQTAMRVVEQVSALPEMADARPGLAAFGRAMEARVDAVVKAHFTSAVATVDAEKAAEKAGRTFTTPDGQQVTYNREATGSVQNIDSDLVVVLTNERPPTFVDLSAARLDALGKKKS